VRKLAIVLSSNLLRMLFPRPTHRLTNLTLSSLNMNSLTCVFCYVRLNS